MTPGNGPARDARARSILVLAHRGEHRDRPENTIGAFLAALAVPGCDGLEFDVRASRDGTPVVAHDVTLARVFGRRTRISRLSTAELAAFGVPTLREALETIPPGAFLDIELKEDVGSALLPILRAARGSMPANVVVSSFDEEAVRTIRRRAPELPTWLNSDRLDDDAVARALALGCRGVAAGQRSIGPVGVAAARAAGLEVAAWTVRSTSRLARLAELGVVAACVEDAALDHARETLAARSAPAVPDRPDASPAEPLARDIRPLRPRGDSA